MEKIFELRIEEDDELSGIDSISLVDEPAIEINWLAFNKVKEEEFHIPDGEDGTYLEKLAAIAQDENELFNDGWVIDNVEILTGKKQFNTNPNRDSEWDEENTRIRYKYMLNPDIKESSIIPTTRDFCKDLVQKNFVWRVEEMDSLVNDFGSPAIVWRGGFNCRHVWGKIRYKREGDITNKASVNKNKETIGGVFPTDLVPDTTILGYPQPSTVTRRTAANPSPSTIKNLGLSKEKFEEGIPHYTKDGKLYEGPTHKDSDGRLMTGLVHTEDSEYLYHRDELGYDVSTITGYVDEVPKKKKKSEDFESYSDYPESAKKAARRALDWVEKNGWGSCGTAVGKARANQLSKGEAISEETIARMASFARHAQNKDVPYSEGCGGLMWDAWGGTAGIEWASNKLESIRKDMSKQKFAIDSEEKRIVIGPAMVPDLKIFRKDEKGNPYHVFFSADTIKMIAEKYMRYKYIDNNDTNHNGEAAKDVYVIESWIKEDKEDKSNKYGFGELPVGTWFVSMKVRNDEVWDKVKNGVLNGFSVSGYFEEVAQFCMEEMFLKELSTLLSKIDD
jgi:hypothetical protein